MVLNIILNEGLCSYEAHIIITKYNWLTQTLKACTEEPTSPGSAVIKDNSRNLACFNFEYLENQNIYSKHSTFRYFFYLLFYFIFIFLFLFLIF